MKQSFLLYFQRKYQNYVIEFANAKSEVAGDIILQVSQRFRIATAFIAFSQALWQLCYYFLPSTQLFHLSKAITAADIISSLYC